MLSVDLVAKVDSALWNKWGSSSDDQAGVFGELILDLLSRLRGHRGHLASLKM